MSAPSHEVIRALATAAVAARCAHVIAEFGVADYIGDEAVLVDELASSCGANPDSLDRVMRLLAAHGVFEYRAGTYAHTAASRLLRTDDPMSMRAFVRMMGLPLMWGSFTELEHSLRTGAPAVQTFAPDGAWAYLKARPHEAEIYGQAMAAAASADISAVVHAYDFRRFARIADIGGGGGYLLRAVLDASPAAEGILFDLPEVIEMFRGDRDRLTLQAGDFFADGLPAADAYMLRRVIHDWADEEAVAILRAVRRAARAGASVLLIEDALSDERPDPRRQTSDLIMLAVAGGRERSIDQLRELLERAGFQPSAVTETAGSSRIVEATAV
jgi:O-methyltransferase